MIILKAIFILYLDVCATICTVELVTRGIGKVDKYITKRRKAKLEANKPVEKVDTFDYSEELQELIQIVQDDSAEFRESARIFIEYSNKYQKECRELLARNDKHIESLMNSKGGTK